MVYNDLNPIRAGIADTPEDSHHTSIRDSIHARQYFHKIHGLRQRAPRRARQLFLQGHLPRHAEDGLWLQPIAACQGTPGAPTGMSVDDYITLVDETGRIVKSGKRGAISPKLKPILKRLDIDVDHWIRAMLSPAQFLGAAIGRATQLAAEAARRGMKWIKKACCLFDPPLAAPPG